MAVDFTVNTNIIDYGDQNAWEFGATDSYTLAGWINIDTTTSASIFNKDTGTGAGRNVGQWKHGAGKLTFTVGTVSTDLQTATETNTMSTGTWYYILFVRNVGTDKLETYRSKTGEAPNTETKSTTDTTTTAHGVNACGFQLGKLHTFTTQTFDGKMSHMAMWYTRVLTDVEMRIAKYIGAWALPTNRKVDSQLWDTTSPTANHGSTLTGTITGTAKATTAPPIEHMENYI